MQLQKYCFQQFTNKTSDSRKPYTHIRTPHRQATIIAVYWKNQRQPLFARSLIGKVAHLVRCPGRFRSSEQPYLQLHIKVNASLVSKGISCFANLFLSQCESQSKSFVVNKIEPSESYLHQREVRFSTAISDILKISILILVAY